jgi:thiol-disulfide isomerase/thioredoxin
MFPVAVVGFYVLFETAGTTSVDSATEQLAAENAGGQVQAFTGPQHTVYHYLGALPSASAPRADRRLTLVWFSSTGCKDCKRMEPFVETTAHEKLDRLAFVEKAIDRDASAQRYGVTAAPTFVLLDAQGTEVARFGFEPDAASFSAAIESAVSKAGAPDR